MTIPLEVFFSWVGVNLEARGLADQGNLPASTPLPDEEQQRHQGQGDAEAAPLAPAGRGPTQTGPAHAALVCHFHGHSLR